MNLSISARIALCFVRFYQLFISPFLGKNCRFLPTCSEYYVEAVQRYGFIRGSLLGFRRILKCGPWNPGGYDPVP